MRTFFGALLFLGLFPPDAAHAEGDGTGLVVELVARFSVTNRGDRILSPYNFYLTYPAAETPYQRLMGIEYGYPDGYSTGGHRNGVDRFLLMPLTVQPFSTVERTVRFRILLSRYDFHADDAAPAAVEDAAGFLKPAPLFESDDPELVRIARGIMQEHQDTEGRLRAAYRYPQDNLRFRSLPAAQGALWAVSHKTGDCTEYAAVFVALSRAMGVPARMTSEFNFQNDTAFRQPNHNAAEAYVAGRWIPVDPNLGLVPDQGYGFGTAGKHKVVLKRDEPWVWSKPGSVKGVPSSYLKEKVDAGLSWEIVPRP